MRDGHHGVGEGRDYRFTAGFKDLLKTRRIRIQPVVSARLVRVHEIITRLARARAEYLEGVCPGWVDLHVRLRESASRDSVARFTTWFARCVES